MLIIEGTIGDTAARMPWYQIVKERVFVGEDVLNRIYAFEVLLRGFQVTYVGTDRHLREVNLRIARGTSVDNPGYIYLEAVLKLRDDHPGGTDYLVTSTGDEKVSIAVDYTIIVW